MGTTEATMHKSPVRVLLIEDDRDDYTLARDLLADIPGVEFHLDWVCDYDAGLEALRRGEHDVCLLDYRLGARNGLDLLREAMKSGCKTATIMLTGHGERELDFAAMESGATDFLEKSRLGAAAPLLERSIRYALVHRRHQEQLERRVEERTAELARANEALKEADRRKNEFLAMLAHELRNPLAPIRNALHILRRADGDGEAVQSASEVMERQVGQMIHLVDDLLDVSRISRGTIELRQERVELASVVHHAVEAAGPVVECFDHDLTVTVPPQPIYLDGDPARLAQVVGNLLNNACKYTEKGGRIWLTVEVEEDKERGRGGEGETGAAHVIIRVRDSGIGIAADQIPRIFDMFTQVDASLERSQSGLGIGLTLVKKLVELHGGTVEVHSPGLGQGSEFVVRLPLASDESQATSDELDDPALPATQHSALTTRRRILVVDDNRDSAVLLARLLSLSGHETHTAHDGLDAVEAAATLRPDVVVLDIGLPQLNGYEAARKIREQPWGKTMVLLALTGWGQDEDRQKSREAGFNAHLVKPVDYDALLNLLVESQPNPA